MQPLKQTTAYIPVSEWEDSTGAYSNGSEAIPVQKREGVIVMTVEEFTEAIKNAYGDGLNAHRTNFCNRDDYFNNTYL